MNHITTDASQVAGMAFGNNSGEIPIPETPELDSIPGESLGDWRQRVALEAAYKLAA